MDNTKALEAALKELEQKVADTGIDFKEDIERLRLKLRESQKTQTGHCWERVRLARMQGRPTALDYVEGCCTDFIELSGDRVFGNDQALIGGPAQLGSHRVMLLLQQKGRDTKGNIKRNFGMSHPEGYRKAIRLMGLAEKFGLPVVALIDTPGAYPGVAAEERGQAWAIAESIAKMASLKVPTLSVIIGEGGSGGALAIGMGNRVLIMQNAWYSVITPESCAAILWHDAKEAPKAAEALRLTAQDLLELGIVEEVIPEPAGGAHCDPASAILALKEAIERNLSELSGLSTDELLEGRRHRFRGIGVFEEI